MNKDLTGQRFGKLTVIKRAEKDKIYGGIRRTTWLCKCDCGNTVEIITSNLTSGTSASCGCTKEQFLEGKRFGLLTVLEKAEEDKYYGIYKQRCATWKCKCDCGNTVEIVGNNLIKGLVTSCGSCKEKYIDLTGKRYGRLTVIKKSENKKKYGDKEYLVWECRCDCGNTIEVISAVLNSGNTTSCGCVLKDYRKAKFVDLTGKKFSMLTVIGKSEKKRQYLNQKYTLWKCVCDCGKEIEVANYELLRKINHKYSCGCTKRIKKFKGKEI